MKISNMLSKYGVSFVGFQETFLTSIDLMCIRSLWGNSSFDFDISLANGHSGGILSIWDPNVFMKKRSFSFNNVLIIEGTWLAYKCDIYMLNVYAPQEEGGKRALWNFISAFMRNNKGHYIIFRDFNSVRSANERFGSRFSEINASVFNEFIGDNDLVDVPLGGYKFTRVDKGCMKGSRIDRVLVTESIWDMFGSLSVLALDRDSSDHHPMLLRNFVADYGPIPFKVYHSWFDIEGFLEVVNQFWSQGEYKKSSSHIINLKNKFQGLKAQIRIWNSKRRSYKDDIETIAAQIREIDHKVDTQMASNLAERRQTLVSQLRLQENRQKEDLIQKARIKWCVDADENTKFFHGMINKKRKQLMVRGVKSNGIWMEEPGAVKQVFLDYFSNKFAKVSTIPYANRRHRFKSLSAHNLELLEAKVTREEVKDAVWCCGSEKAPGPDGFTFGFIKKFWDVLKEDIYMAINEFFEVGQIPLGCNASFITLIPKNESPILVSDFRPISLICVIYKIISKVLANRIAMIIDELVDPVQSAFVKNRQILDGPMILNELVTSFKCQKKNLMLFKVDIDKAYDTLSWEYLLSILDFMGFGCKSISWVRSCLHSARSSILINGSPSKEFGLERGLRQGDPLAPFLFILAMEGFHVAMEDAIEAKMFKGVRIRDIHLSHLIYADDVIMLGEWSEANFINAIDIFDCFYLASGLQINVTKSKLYGIGVPDMEVDRLARMAGCKGDKIPFIHLGVPIGTNMRRVTSWRPVVDKVAKRLSKWRAKMLSIGGRAVLTSSVLGALPTYYMSLFHMPVAVCNKIEAMRAKFFWGADSNNNKIHWVKWDLILASKDKGGMGIGSIRALNLALMYKWKWRFLNSPQALWVKVITNLYPTTTMMCIAGKDVTSHNPGTWHRILNLLHELNGTGKVPVTAIKKKIGNGRDTEFWNDIWLEDVPLSQKYECLYMLENQKNCKIADRWNGHNLMWNWRRNIRGGLEHSSLKQLAEQVNSVTITNLNDRWRWYFEGVNEFTVSSIRKHIDNIILPSHYMPTRWNTIAPRKVNIHVWRVLQDRIPTRCNLWFRGVHNNSLICPLCGNGLETTFHIMSDCNVARKVWTSICKWLDQDLSFDMEPTDLLNHVEENYKSDIKTIILTVIYAVWWELWKFRNDTVFNSHKSREMVLVDSIISYSYQWFHYRRKKMGISWYKWIKNPILSLILQS